MTERDQPMKFPDRTRGPQRPARVRVEKKRGARDQAPDEFVRLFVGQRKAARA
jgi:hypothetical protein